MAENGFRTFDPAAYLRDEEEAMLYLQGMVEDAGEDAASIALALGDVVRSQSDMATVAKKTGLSRESLCKALSGQRTPSFATILKVLGALGFQFAIVRRPQQQDRAPMRDTRSAVENFYFETDDHLLHAGFASARFAASMIGSTDAPFETNSMRMRASSAPNVNFEIVPSDDDANDACAFVRSFSNVHLEAIAA